MPTLTKTTTLIADLATALGPDAPQPADGGGYRVAVDAETDVLIYGEDDETILVVAPIMQLPFAADYATALYLLRLNMIGSPTEPFHLAADPGGGLIMWGRLPVSRLDGPSLAGMMRALAEYLVDIRLELAGEEAVVA